MGMKWPDWIKILTYCILAQDDMEISLNSVFTDWVLEAQLLTWVLHHKSLVIATALLL